MTICLFSLLVMANKVTCVTIMTLLSVKCIKNLVFVCFTLAFVCVLCLCDSVFQKIL